MAISSFRFLHFCALLVLCCATLVAAKPILRFRQDGTFHILQITDLHLGNIFKDGVTKGVIKNVIEAEKPDLVVISGDVQCTDPIVPDVTKMVWKTLTETLNKENVPWAFVNGNHDTQADKTGREIVLIDSSYPNSLTELGPSTVKGFSNYVLHVWPYDNSSKVPAFNIWMMDSQETACEGVSGNSCCYPDQVQWYKLKAQEMATSFSALRAEETGQLVKRTSIYDGLPPSFAFMHIPFPEFINLWNYHPVNGTRQENICCWSVNTGLYTAMKEVGDVRLVGAGHDHNNDYVGDYYGISLAYGRKTGENYYGPPKGIQKGARAYIIRTEPSFSFTTYIRQQDKSIDYQKEHKPSGTDANWNHCSGADDKSTYQ
eukprot:TRINITY_DN345_c0_g1_i1.p1 TRINITY_DN345_c0_g1~~TRINITY_DN345_c0_g1_i1.p1  ORF type:complete len:373 (-),score=60.07 TRINITY_DN345_c0_g1_i1:455-1573(-)